MKRFRLVPLVGLLVFSLSLVACGAAAPAASEAEEPAETEALVEGDGSSVKEEGWQALAGAEPALSDEERDVFDRAARSFGGPSLEPIAVLATQQVSGTNYAFLCAGADGASWHVAVAYQNLDGEARVTSSQELKMDELRVATGAPIGALLGSWQVKDQTGAQLVPPELAEAFGKVGDTYASATLDPIAALATREGEGHDYLVLCEGEAKEEDAPRSLFVVAVQVGDDGAAQLLDVAQLEFFSLVSASA